MTRARWSTKPLTAYEKMRRIAAGMRPEDRAILARPALDNGDDCGACLACAAAAEHKLRSLTLSKDTK